MQAARKNLTTPIPTTTVPEALEAVLARIEEDLESDPDIVSYEWLPPKPGDAARLAWVCRCCNIEEIFNFGWSK